MGYLNHRSLINKEQYLECLTDFHNLPALTEHEFHDLFCEKKYKRCKISDLQELISEHFSAFSNRFSEDMPFATKIIGGGYVSVRYNPNGERRLHIPNPEFALIEVLCLVPPMGNSLPYLHSAHMPLDNFYSRKTKKKPCHKKDNKKSKKDGRNKKQA